MKAFRLQILSLTWPILFFIAGICSSTYDILNHSDATTIAALILLGIGGVYWYRHRHQVRTFLIHLASVLLFLILGWSITTFQQKSFEHYVQWLDRAPQVTGVVSDVTHFANMDRVRVRLPIRHWWSSRHYFLINVLNKEVEIHKGQTIRVNQRLSRIPKDQIPYQFRAREYWALHHTSHEVFLHDSTKIETLETKPPGAIARLREKAMVRLDTLYPIPAQAGILKALLAGQKDGLTTEVKSNFKNAGLLHILAVSGLHVGIVFGLLYLLLYPLHVMRIHQGFHYGIIICALWMYAAWTGLNVPVVRAVILMTFYLTAARLRRQINSWNIYLWAVFIVLVLHPRTLFSVSFQLSFGAVAAILLFFKPIQRWLTPTLGQNYFTSLIAVSIAAQLGVLPFLLWHFQEISIVSTISGLLVIPLLFPLILFSSASLLIPPSWTWVTETLNSVSKIIVGLMLDISDMTAGWTFSSVTVVWHPATLILLGIAIILGGLYLELRYLYHPTWVLNATLGLIALSAVSEIGNIYHKRTTPYAVIMEHRREHITELYYKGYCYSSTKIAAPPFLQKLRKKYHTKKVIPINGDRQWENLIATITMMKNRSGQSGNISIQVANYISGEFYGAHLDVLMAEPEPPTDRLRISPVMSTLKNRENE